MSRKPYQIALGEPEQITMTGDVEPLGMVADDHAAAAAAPMALDTVQPVTATDVMKSPDPLGGFTYRAQTPRGVAALDATGYLPAGKTGPVWVEACDAYMVDMDLRAAGATVEVQA
jgi:hypothetical protein